MGCGDIGGSTALSALLLPGWSAHVLLVMLRMDLLKSMTLLLGMI